jgi:hypothetical protein
LEVAQSLANFSQDPSDPEDMVSLFTANARDRVLVDSGATHCTTPLVEALSDFIPQKIMLSMAGQGQSSMAQGKGTLGIRFHGDTSQADYDFPNAIGDPNQRHTLLATKSLQKCNITSTFPGGTDLCILSDTVSGKELCRGRGVGNNLYELPISVLYPDSLEYSAKVLSVQMSSTVHHALAHLRCAHINANALRSVVRDGKLKDVTVKDLGQNLFCLGCKLGKAAQLP